MICPSFLCPPFQPLQASSEPGTRSCGRQYGFWFFLLLLFPLPQSREISLIKIDLRKKSQVAFGPLSLLLTLMLMNPDVVRTLLYKK